MHSEIAFLYCASPSMASFVEIVLTAISHPPAFSLLSDEIDRNNQYLEEAQGSADQCARSIDQYGREVKEAGAASEKFGRQSTGAVEALAQAFVAAGGTFV